MKDEILNKHYSSTIYYLLRNHLNLAIDEKQIHKIKPIFIKYYSDTLLKRVKFLIKHKLFIITRFYSNDDIEYIDEKEHTFILVDLLYLFSFKIEDKRHYLCYSTKYDKSNDGTSIEKVEFFTS